MSAVSAPNRSFAPRLTAQARGLSAPARAAANPAAPNLYIVKPVGNGASFWPIGAIVPKGAFPHGFTDLLELAVVVETDRPATHGRNLAGLATAVPATPDDLTIENAKLRCDVVDLETKLAAYHEAVVRRDERIAVLTADLAAAESLLAGAKEAVGVQEGADTQARYTAGPVGAPPGLPVVPAPWQTAAAPPG